MRYLINSIEASGDEVQTRQEPDPQIVSLQQALSTADVAVIDPGFLSEADIAALFPNGPACTFSYTTGSPPALAIGEVDGQTAGLIKLSGDLVRVDAISATQFGVDGLSINLREPADSTASLEATGPEPVYADMYLELEAGLTAGYRGFYNCSR